jgi:hypothetical protein
MTEDEARQALLARRAELDREDASNADSRNTVELQQDSVGRLSRMDAMQQQAMAQATERRRVAERAHCGCTRTPERWRMGLLPKVRGGNCRETA